MKYRGELPTKIVKNMMNCIRGYLIAIGVATKNITAGWITLVTLFDKLFNIIIDVELDNEVLVDDDVLILAKTLDPEDEFFWCFSLKSLWRSDGTSYVPTC